MRASIRGPISSLRKDICPLGEASNHAYFGSGNWVTLREKARSLSRRGATILPNLMPSLFSARPDFAQSGPSLSLRPKDNAHMVRCAVIGELDMRAARPERYAIELN